MLHQSHPVVREESLRTLAHPVSHVTDCCPGIQSVATQLTLFMDIQLMSSRTPSVTTQIQWREKGSKGCLLTLPWDEHVAAGVKAHGHEEQSLCVAGNKNEMKTKKSTVVSDTVSSPISSVWYWFGDVHPVLGYSFEVLSE